MHTYTLKLIELIVDAFSLEVSFWLHEEMQGDHPWYPWTEEEIESLRTRTVEARNNESIKKGFIIETHYAWKDGRVWGMVM